MKVQLLIRSYNQMIGLARYSACIVQALRETEVEHTLVVPSYPFLISLMNKALAIIGYDLRTFFTTYPLGTKLERKALTHMTAQQMGTLLWFKPRLHPVIITVHDIVPYLVKKDKNLTTFQHPFNQAFDQLAMSGLKRADALISVSHYTKKTITENIGIPANRIHVIHEGVDHTVFHPKSIPQDFFQRFQLERGKRTILYVGSENPRKNLPRLLEAFAKIQQRFPDVRLVKIGSPEFLPQAEKLHQRVISLGLEGSVTFIDHVSDEDLAHFYNYADVFVFPSIYEGFGLPPLEAMACGAPVVCSRAASLPEVVGEAALTFDPYDVEAMAAAIGQVLEDPALATTLQQKGLARARQFTWERTAQETIQVYQHVWDEWDRPLK